MKLRLPLNLRAALMAAVSFVSFVDSSSAVNTGNSISINFGGNYGLDKQELLVGATGVAIAGKLWNLTNANSGQITNIKNSKGESSGVSASWGTHQWNLGSWTGNPLNANKSMMDGYIDESATCTFENIEYLFYDVYIYTTTQNANQTSKGKQVNGVNYTYKDGKLTLGSDGWGADASRTDLIEGQNYMKVSTYGSKLTVTSEGMGGSWSNTSGIQIVETDYSGVYEETTLTNGNAKDWMAKGDNSHWTIKGVKTDWKNSTGTGGGDNSHIAKIKVSGTAGLALKDGETAIMDALFVEGGGVLNINNGTIKLINHTYVSVDGASTVLNLNTTLAAEKDIRFLGTGLTVLKKDQTWTGIYGVNDIRVQNDANLTLTGDRSTPNGIILTGSGNFYMNGNGSIKISKGSALTGDGKIYANKGVLLFSTVDWFTDELSKRINLSSKGTILLDAVANGISSIAPLIGKGNVKMGFYNPGGKSGGDLGMALDLSKSNYSNEIILKSGLLNTETSNLVNSEGKKDFVIVLDGGGIIHTTTSTETVTFENDIVVGAGGGFLRDYTNKSSLYTGKISGSGQLTHEDGGTMTIAGDISEFSGEFWQNEGSVVFAAGTNAHIKNYRMFSPGGSKTGSLTVLGKMTVAQDFYGGGIIWNSNDTPTLNIGDDQNTQAKLTVNKLLFFQSQGQHTINLKSGTLNVLGTGNDVFFLGDWAYTQGFFNQTGGTLNILNENIRIYSNGYNGKDSHRAIWKMMNGTANVKGISFAENKNNTNRRGELYFTGGTINIGSYGIDALTATAVVEDKTDYVFQAGGATFGALDSWTSKMDMALTGAVVFDTRSYVADSATPGFSGGFHTITWDASLSDVKVKEGEAKIIGSIEKVGAGTLVLSKDNTFTGGVTLKGGSLSLGAVNALGAADHRNLKVEGKGTLITSLSDKIIDNLNLTTGSRLALDAPTGAMNLNIGTYQGNGSLVMDLFKDGISDNVTIATLADGSTFNLNLVLNSDAINQTYTLLKGVGGATLDKISVDAGYRDTLILTESLDSGNYKIAVSGSISSKTVTWNGNAATGTWKLKDAASWDSSSGGYYQADDVVFGAPGAVDASGNQVVTLDGILAPKSVTVTTSENHNYVFTSEAGSGSYLTGGMSLTKEGAGTLLIKTGDVSNYSGKTTVNGGVLEFASGSFSGKGEVLIGEQGTLKVHDMLSNTIVANGTLALAFSGYTTKDLGTLSNVTWGANSTLAIASGVAKGDKAMFSGKTISVLDGGAFDLSGQDRSAKQFELVLAGKGVQQLDGTYTGALFNSGGSLSGKQGIKKLSLADDAMLVVGGGNASGVFTDGNRYEIYNALVFGNHTLSKRGQGMLALMEGSASVDGKLIIEEGFALLTGLDFGTKAASTSMEIKRGAGWVAWGNDKNNYADILLDSSATDATKGYINNRNWATLTSTSGNYANYWGDVTLKNGGVIMIGGAYNPSVAGTNTGLFGALNGTGTLYVDQSASTFNDRCLYLGSEISGIDGIEMIGRADTSVVFTLQLGTHGLYDAVEKKNATIADGLKITGGRDAVVKIVASGQAASYTKLNFLISESQSEGMLLRVDRQSSDEANNFLTTLIDTTGTLQKLALGVGGKLTLSGATDLTLNTDLAIAGEKALFSMDEGKLTVKKNVAVETSSQINVSGNGNMIVSGNFSLNGTGSKLMMSGGIVATTGQLNMSGGSQFEISEGVFNSNGINLANEGALLTVSGGTLNFTGKTGIGVWGGGNNATVNQSGGTVNMTDVWMSEWSNTGKMSYYNLTKGTLNVSGDFQVGNDGSATLAISGGVANIKQLSLGKWSGSNQQYIVELLGDGRLNIGTGGLINNNTDANKGSAKKVILSGGTLGALADKWSTSVELTLKNDVNKTDGLVVDTTKVGQTTGSEITWSGTVKNHTDGGAKLSVTGVGTLVLAGVNDFTADVTLKDSSTLKLNSIGGMKSKVIIRDSATFLMGANDLKTTNAFEVQGGQILLDKTGVGVGAVTLNGASAAVNMTAAGVSTGAVTLTSGAVNVSANATVASLSATGGSVNISAGILTSGNSNLGLTDLATLKFTGNGNLATGTIVTTTGDNAVVELGNLKDGAEEPLAYAFTLKGNGKLLIKDGVAQSFFNGVANEFDGKVDVQATGQLTLGAATSMGAQSTANVAGHLVFAGVKEQVGSIIGVGRVSFSNQNANITKASLFSGFEGNLFIGSDQKVTFTGTGVVGASLLGGDMSVEFGGNSSGILVLNNTHETVHDVILTSSGSIQLRGADVMAVLDGTSWLGNGTEQSKLTLDVGSNKIFVADTTLTDAELDRLWMITDMGSGGVVLDTDSGELKLDQAIELRVSSVYAPAQSYQLTADHSGTGNRHTLDGNTSIRSLMIQASATNSELLLKDGVKLGLKQGRLTIANKPGESVPYTITGGSIGMLSAINPADTLSSQLSIYQDAAGLVTITSTIDDTVFQLSKKGTGDMLLSGVLKNKGGVLVEGGSLSLTGSSVMTANAKLGNRAKLSVGDGKKAYQVNYAGLDALAGSTTTFNALSVIKNDFVVNNAGSLNLLMGTGTRFDKAFTGAGTTLIGNKTAITLPHGAVQNFTVEKGSSLTMELSSVASSGKTMKGEGDVVLKNTSGAALNLNTVEIGTSWLGFTGKVTMLSDYAMTLNLGLMGTGASLEVSKGGRVNDTGTETTARDYNVTLGDDATWSLANGVSYKGTLELGSVGTLTQMLAVMDSTITGGQLNVQDGHLTLSGNNTHQMTNVGVNTTVTGTSAGAFGKGLQLSAQGAQAQIDGDIVTGTLTVGGVSGLELKSGSLTVTGQTDFNGTLSGAGDLYLGDSSTLGGNVTGDIAGITVNIMKGELTLSSELGKANVNVAAGARLTISGNTGLSDNTITLGAGSSLTGGSDFNGILNVVGNGTDSPLVATVNGSLNVQSLHLKDPTAGLEVNGNMSVGDGGSFLLSDANTQGAIGGSIVKSTGTIELSGIFAVDLNVNESFTHNEETISFQLFKGEQGLNVNLPDTEHVSLAIDETIREFFTLDQSTFTKNGIISLKRQEMVCVLLDPSNTATGGSHQDGHISGNANTYLGANKNNNGTAYPEVFFYDKSYTIAEGDNAYRLTSGEAWMNFHVAMTDQQLNAATKVVIRRMEKAGEMPTNAGGVILSIRGNADNTYSGGTQIYQAKVKVDGTLNTTGTGTVSEGDVYFFGTGRVEATGNEAAIILNTGGNNSNGSYMFNNDFLLQQGAVLEQTSSSNILMGNLTTKGVATIRNGTNNDLILSGSRLNGDTLHIQGAEGKTGAVTLEGVTGEKVAAKFTTVDVNNNGHLSVGRNATTNITSLYLDKGSSLTMTEGGVFGVKEMKNGSNGAGDVYLSGGTFKLLSDMALTENGAKYHVTSSSTYDTNGYYLEVNQYLADWSDFTVTGGGTMLLLKDLSSFNAHATITGDSTKVTISKDKTLAGSWTVRDGGILRTEENVSIRGILNLEKGGSTQFGLGTKLDMATLNFKGGSTYSGFLKGDGSTVNFEGGSHFQVRTEDLRQLTDSDEKALLSSGEVKISNGKGFFNFSGGDGIVNDALLDSEEEKTLIIGTESLTVGGLGDSITRAGTLGVEASELTGEQLAAMVGENNYRWLSFVLTADKVGETGSKINVTVTRNVNFSELAETSNEIAIAPTLSYIGMEGGKADSKLQGEGLNMLGLALTKATGDAHQMMSNISLSTSSIMAGYSVQRENLRRHTLELRDRAVQERPCALRNQYETLENTLWASGQGGTYSVDGDNNAVGHTTSLWGGQLGVSRCVNDNLVLGLAFTYTTSDITLDKGMGEATSDAYYIDLYAKYHKDNWNVTGILTGGFTDMETDRNMAIEGFRSRTKGSSSGNQLMGMVEVGYEFDLDGDRSNIIEPFAALTAGYSSIDGFEETGADSAGLNVASQSDTSCSIGAGVRYVKEFSTSSDELLRGRFEVRAMILQDLTDNEVDVEAGFIGANGHSFSQKSTEIGKTGFLLGTGVVVPTSANMSFFADLNGEFRSSETGCNANIGVKYSF